MSIQTKLLAAFGAVVLLMLAVGLTAVLRLSTEHRHLEHLAAVVVPSTRAVGDIESLMNKYRKDQLHYVVARPADRPSGVPESVADDLSRDLSRMSALLSAYRSDGLVEDSADLRLLDGFRADFARYVTLTAAFRPLADAGRLGEGSDAVSTGPGDRGYDRLKTRIKAWNDHHIETADAAAASSRASNRTGVRLILALLTAATLIAGTVAIVLARRTTRAVRSVGSAATAIAQGDIDQRVTVRSRDELGDMADDFASMVDYLRSTTSAAETIADGDLSVEIKPRSARDALGNALLRMTDSLRRLEGENERLLAVSRAEAHTDALTGLLNRRALIRDLEQQAVRATEQRPCVLALLDLDGFKHYNDTFGHPAGDALLVRLGERLQLALGDRGTAYRLGGDEFCVLAETDAAGGASLVGAAAAALSESGEAFVIGCSHGTASLPADGAHAEAVLHAADQRMYERKSGRISASRQSTDVLLKVLSERNPGLHDHLRGVALIASSTAEALGLPDHEIKRIGLAAELHDVGKVAIPDSMLNKPGPLNDEEWAFMQRHTLIGERILRAAPSLARTAELVRSSHERFDGAGYPDKLAGNEIPIGARIVNACDAFDAMCSERPYSPAMTVEDAQKELRRCSGSQFDPQVVKALCAVLQTEASAVLAGA